MLSNIASLLILGIGRFIVDRIWGVAAFGKFSFSLSLTNFFLLFISQVSMVLFPTLRRTSGEQQKVFYNVSRNILDILLAGIFLFYVPITYLLELWLPQYSESIKYLILLLPLCTFDGKMQMLCTTYLKVMNKERTLLKINVLSMIISLVLSLMGGYVFKNINLIIIFMVVTIAIRSVVAEVYLSKLMDMVVIKSIVYEMSLAVIFVASTWFLRSSTSFVIYFVVYSIYIFTKRKDINEIRKSISGLINE
jgi:O-antigen/teichoic acid export membrane protein